MDYRAYIAGRLHIEGMSAEEIAAAIAVPPDPAMGDYALPCFKFAKIFRKSPALIAEALRDAFVCDGVIGEVSAVNGYLNFKVCRAGLARDVLARIGAEGGSVYRAFSKARSGVPSASKEKSRGLARLRNR